jgi:hypothetical protein
LRQAAEEIFTRRSTAPKGNGTLELSEPISSAYNNPGIPPDSANFYIPSPATTILYPGAPGHPEYYLSPDQNRYQLPANPSYSETIATPIYSYPQDPYNDVPHFE